MSFQAALIANKLHTLWQPVKAARQTERGREEKRKTEKEKQRQRNLDKAKGSCHREVNSPC